MISLTIRQKTVDIFPANEPNSPAIYLNTYGHEGRDVYERLRAGGCRDFSLIAVSDLSWDHDMAPWEIPPISKNDTPCTGGADDYLALLLESILPEAETHLPGAPSWRGLAGYSLAGLFAVYAIYKTDVFSRIASMSGSLWFPDFQAFVFSHTPLKAPDCMYFSLGSKEDKTRNPFLQPVRQNTQAIEAFFKSRGIETVFEINPGNHFQHALERSAAGLLWILNR